ncbi:OmpA/MotB domain protein [Allomuricauda ruestringensis DSM 13258]|uniref:OmpA/MotB domain protein n=1 Tax=Allomuricauda ruestringensis (strain DSM 13258 / CIP 107369 / LMG 19739 / B1) TaxID=886377 RepID=G2PK62_ALLRU|nr:OmpA family protein [Allomuricauda ruestringensis]AEM72047.1 OmpA/MotB domain protein [Allomuricauda ruestringensis DSM 13258]
MYPKTILKILMAVLMVSTINAQKSVVKKANEDFDAYNYIDAREIYLNIVEDGYESPQVLKKLGDTYYFNSEYAEAVKWYKRLMEKHPNDVDPIYYYRASQSFKSIGEYHTSKKMMGKFAGLSANTEIAKNFMKDYPALDSLVGIKSSTYEVDNITGLLTSSDFAPSFYGDKIVYASSSTNTEGDKIHNWTGLPYLDLFEADIDEDWRLSNPKPLEGDINTPYHESNAVFTKDGKTVYFTRNNYSDGRKKKSRKKLISLKIYKATKTENGTWTNIEELPFNNDSYSAAHPALSPDEKRLYFSSDMEGTHGDSDIWYVDILEGGTYGTPVNLGPEINTETREGFPFIGKNNNLYFSSDGHLGLGGLDIFVVSLEPDGEFKEVTNLKQPINSNKDDFGFILDEEKKIGYLASNRDGDGGSSSDDIYRVWESCGIMVIQGAISDSKTGKTLVGVTVKLLNKNNNVITETTTDESGNYVFKGVVDCSKKYTVHAEYKDYTATDKSTVTPRGTHTVQMDMELTPPECPVDDLGCRLTLEPIYFDYGKHTIRSDSEVELAKILQAMKQYPELSIHIESHTDSRSSDRFNLRLSERRAQATLNWFVKQGIDRSRLSAKGYGETQLLNECSNGVNCSEEQHQLNRRSMFIIKD